MVIRLLAGDLMHYPHPDPTSADNMPTVSRVQLVVQGIGSDPELRLEFSGKICIIRRKSTSS
jgi:hypothetical protein